MATDTLTVTPDLPLAAPPSIAPLRHHRITVDEFERMIEANVFGAKPRIELIGGVLVDKPRKDMSELVAVNLVRELLHGMKPSGSCLFSIGSITIVDRDSDTQPDAMIVQGDIHDYLDKRITPAEVQLVVDVANTSIESHRGAKPTLYAVSGVPVYWIVDILTRCLVVYARPTPHRGSGVYALTQFFSADQDAPFEIDGREIGRVLVKDLLP